MLTWHILEIFESEYPLLGFTASLSQAASISILGLPGLPEATRRTIAVVAAAVS